MIQDRAHVRIGKKITDKHMTPWIRIDMQEMLNSYQRYKGPHTLGWNACQGGLPLSVLHAIQEGGCPLVFSESEWLGYPNPEAPPKEANLNIRLSESTRIVPTSMVQNEILANGSVVLCVNASILKDVDKHGVAANVSTPKVANHAVCVVGGSGVKTRIVGS